MALHHALDYIDTEIARLQKARALLSGTEELTRPGPGRPRGSKNLTAIVAASPSTKSDYRLTPEGRQAIANAMKRRWATRRKELAN